MPLADYTVRSGRWYSATPVVSAGNETKPNKTRVFWAQRPGAVGSAMLTTSAAQVGSLVVEVANLLKLEAPLDSIVLQLVAKDKNGMDCSVRLNNMDTIKKALAKASKELGRPIHPKENLSLVASVVAAPLAVVAAPLAASAAALDAQARLLRSVRASLKQQSPLMQLFTLSLSSPGLTALSASSAGRPPSLAKFDMPGIPKQVVVGPKGLDVLIGAGGSVLLDQERLRLSQEFLKAMTDPVTSAGIFGVLLSGPNGVGKSAVGMLSFLACAAQGLPVVYIPRAGDWVTAAKEGNGDAFFLHTLLKQNADIIQSDAELMGVFDSLMRHMDETGQSLLAEGGAFSCVARTTMQKLVLLLESRSQAFGVIVDETQKITEAIERDNLTYFKEGWYGWQYSPGNAFVRMDIASSHGLRELRLDSGERFRLRFVRPWTRDVVMDFLSNSQSPGFLEDTEVRERVHYICGGVLRWLADAKRLLGDEVATPEDLDSFEIDVRSEMKTSCERFMSEADPITLKKCASSIANLVRGSTFWEDLKPAYDQGLVTLTQIGRRAVPVSSVAASVLHRAFAIHLRERFIPLDEEPEGPRRGYAFETQLHAVLDPCDKTVSTFTLDGSQQSQSVTLLVDYALPFSTVTKTASPATTSVLYLPKSSTYPCDAIIVPAAADPAAAVVLVECSVTPPTDSKRLEKFLMWFRPAPKSEAAVKVDAAKPKRAPEEYGGFIDMVKATYPERRVIALICWLGRFQTSTGAGAKALDSGGSDSGTPQSKVFKKQLLIQTAREAGVQLCVVDTPELEGLGIWVSR